MITYYNRTHMTAVPTGLLQDTHLSVEAKGSRRNPLRPWR